MLKSKSVTPTLQNLRHSLLKKVKDLVPNHSILKKKLLNGKDDVCNDIMALAPLSYISQETTSPDNDKDDTTKEAEATNEVKAVDSSVDTASGGSKCGEGDNPTRVAELELKVAALEQEIARCRVSKMQGGRNQQ